MNLSELWRLYEADKRIQGFSQQTLKAYVLQHKMLILEHGDLEISEITLTMLKESLLNYWAGRIVESYLEYFRLVATEIFVTELNVE